MYTHRYVAKFTIEAETPLSVGSGEKGLVTDRLVAKDANGLPYIPGTSLTGVLRHSFSDLSWANEIFGEGGNGGKGSRLIVSSAILIGEDGKTIMEGLRDIDWNSPYYSHFNRLPERDHVRINHKGAADAENHGKYDEELVHKGTRFVFEIELIGNAEDVKNWKRLLDAFFSPAFRIGAGTRKGFGKLKIIRENSKAKTFDLSNVGLKAYLQKSSSLNDTTEGWEDLIVDSNTNELEGWKKYTLKIKPRDFFLFSAGYGDDDADNKPKTEKYFEWKNGKPRLIQEDFLLIPATSIKGAIAHRVAYYFNVGKGQFIGQNGSAKLVSTLNVEEAIDEIVKKFDVDNVVLDAQSPEWERIQGEIESMTIKDLHTWVEFKNVLDEEVEKIEDSSLPVGESNAAVKALFGFSKDSECEIEGLRGRVVLNDIYLPCNKSEDKVFNHTKIDRFTNGTIDGALFQEKAAQFKEAFEMNIWVDAKAFENDAAIQTAFEKTLNDLINGRLPLGGNTTKGHGIFQGNLTA